MLSRLVVCGLLLNALACSAELAISGSDFSVDGIELGMVEIRVQEVVGLARFIDGPYHGPTYGLGSCYYYGKNQETCVQYDPSGKVCRVSGTVLTCQGRVLAARNQNPVGTADWQRVGKEWYLSKGRTRAVALLDSEGRVQRVQLCSLDP